MESRDGPQLLSSKESSCNAGDTGLIPGLGRFLGRGHGNTLQYSYWENSMDRGAWQFILLPWFPLGNHKFVFYICDYF